jgi:hypothetical protein
VVVRYVERGCFRGSFRGLAGHAPTNRSYEVTAIEWFQLSGGKIRERWGASGFLPRLNGRYSPPASVRFPTQSRHSLEPGTS